MGARRQRQVGRGKGTCPLSLECCKVFCALAVTVKKTLSRLIIYALFAQFLEGRSGSFSSFGLFLGRRLKEKKDRQLFLKKNANAPSREKPGYAYEFAHPWKKNPAGPHECDHYALLIVRCA